MVFSSFHCYWQELEGFSECLSGSDEIVDGMLTCIYFVNFWGFSRSIAFKNDVSLDSPTREFVDKQECWSTER